MSLALYRRYRPESFEDVVGQGHVTDPLMQALRTGRVNHAYLFSGPRGCGKTTSARILARCLNCEQGPTPTPCGTCPSCRDLARGGPGSLDVLEIDAASHGGVDDARDLRDRVAMAPVRDRYRVYIIDEAHMVSTQGFNALLKVVEEPPEHVKFVFATTEPDKVLQTIRSRTHHYAFRLVPPDVLIGYLGDLCESEQVPVGQGVLPLVVRAGQGSVRDSLSVLDQLIAGAGDAGLDYQGAVALLGYTDNALLDDITDALAAADGAALFEVVNRIIESGHDPRRFVEDLLERLRDLVLVQAMGPAADGVLRAVPRDQLDRMRTQAAQLGAAELSRAADVTNTALAEMVGASSPRIHLELLCARLLLPGADDASRGLAPRIERLERRLGDGPIAATAPAGASGQSPRTAPPSAAHSPAPAAARPTSDSGRAGADVPQPPAESVGAPASAAGPARQSRAGSAPTPDATSRPVAEQSGSTDLPEGRQSAPVAPLGTVDTERMRRSWPELLGLIERRRRATWMLLSAGAGVHDLADGVLTLSFVNQGAAKGFTKGQHQAVVAEAVRELFNLTVSVVPYAGPSGPAPSQPRSADPGESADRHRSQSLPAQPPPAQAPQPERSQPRRAESSGSRSPAGSTQAGSVQAGSTQAGPTQPDAGSGAGASREVADEPDWPEPVQPARQSEPPTSTGSGPAARASQPTATDDSPAATSSGQRGGGGRPVSTVDAWGVPFADEPPEDEPPPDDGQTAIAAGPTTHGRAGSRTEPPVNQAAAPVSQADKPASQPAAQVSQAAAPASQAAGPASQADLPAGRAEVASAPPTGEAASAPGRPARKLSRFEQMRSDHLAKQAAAAADGPGAAPIADLPSIDDADAEDAGLVGPAVVERLLGGKVIDIEES